MSEPSAAALSRGDEMTAIHRADAATECDDPRGSPGEPAGFVTAALRRLAAETSPRSVAVVTVPAPLVPLERLLGLLPKGPAMLWDPPSGSRFSGVGAALRIETEGPDRMAALRARAETLWPRLRRRSARGCASLPPRLFGGFAFVPGAVSAGPWRTFGDGSFVLPRWCYGRGNGGSWLSLAVVDPAPAEAAGWGCRVVSLLAALGRARVPAPEATAAAHLEPLPRSRWTEEVEAIRTAIRRGRCAKIVLARRCPVELAAAVDPASVLTRLATRFPDCFRFAFRRADATFLGATPERLIRKRGEEVATEALAGSIERPPSPAAHVEELGRELLGRRKEREEHRLVVDALRERLASWCARLEVPERPGVRVLPDLLHLQTAIVGRLDRACHVLDLVEALHPTPAVGGVPREVALAWIARREEEPRGWYAAPVGWFDAAGDGEFAVAIRSALLRGRRADLYAGAGIVADSDPEVEYAEIGWKQRALLGALGAADGG